VTLGAAIFFALGCDLNPLGGDKSKLDPLFEPGKHIQSAAPIISNIPNLTMDENDIQIIPFTISDSDTFMVCSSVFVKAYSSNETLIDSSGLLVGGTYPNCTLTVTPKSFQYGISTVKVEVYDFWTKVSTNFQLNVLHILSPGFFSITDAEGGNTTIDVTWSPSAYMTGSSAHYALFYREAGTSTFTQIPNVTSPYLLTNLVNGTVYDIYIEARNAVGSRNTTTIQAQPGKYRVLGAEFTPASSQFENTPGTNTNVQIVNSTFVTTETIADANYPALAYSAPEAPPNSAIPVGAIKPSTLTTPSGRYKVYMTSQSNILSGDAP
jgi:hypothetical protein